MPGSLARFLRLHRMRLSFSEAELRAVYRSTLANVEDPPSLASLLANQAVPFYRPIPALVEDLEGGLPLSTFKEALARLPTAPSFRSSHFGEIVACIFAEEVLGLRRIYSKLSLLTAENANAFKMDLLMYDPSTDPWEVVLCEVKSSPKHADDGMPPRHDTSCYADVFNSLRGYDADDLSFDLAAARDRLGHLPAGDRERLKAALRPYSSQQTLRYAAAAVIDESTFNADEARILATRNSPKEFEVDVVGLDGYASTADEVFARLDGVLKALRDACS